MKLQINIMDLNTSTAEKRAKLAETIANNMTVQALEVMAEKSKKPGMSDKLIRFKNMI